MRLSGPAYVTAPVLRDIGPHHIKGSRRGGAGRGHFAGSLISSCGLVASDMLPPSVPCDASACSLCLRVDRGERSGLWPSSLHYFISPRGSIRPSRLPRDPHGRCSLLLGVLLKMAWSNCNLNKKF